MFEHTGLINILTDPASLPTFFPFVLDCHQLYELIVAQGEGRSPMTSSEAEADSKLFIININIINFARGRELGSQILLRSAIGGQQF